MCSLWFKQLAKPSDSQMQPLFILNRRCAGYAGRYITKSRGKAMKFHFLRLLLCISILPLHAAEKKITKQDYLTVLKQCEKKYWQIYNESLSTWQTADPKIREIDPPKLDLALGRMDALLYSETNDIRYAVSARRVLLECVHYDNYYSLYVLQCIKKSGVLDPADLEYIHKKIIDTADRNVQYWTEWGTMNHCSDIVNGLTAAMQYFPNHPNYPQWRKKRDINLSVNWGYWHIEDSQNYIASWMKPLIQTVELMGKEKEFFRIPQVKYYFDYVVQLMTPEGQVAKFGDGNPAGDYTWTMLASMLEKGATIYRDGRMKWAAHQLFKSNIYGKGQGYVWYLKDIVEAYLWADDTVLEEVPSDKSRLVLEDYVGKKVVFRNGWDSNATYLFLNYMDDAPFGIDGKEEMITTIPVETEKNHHGQADENAICLLMKNGAILLHDAGYRETSTTGPDGEDRADTFHNRVVVRDGLADAQKRLLPFLLDGGQCRPVKTKLMHFRTFHDVDVSRTRVLDAERGYQWDRVISYIKNKEWFVVFDFVKILKTAPLTLTTLFYTQDVVDCEQQNNTWCDTRYRTVSSANQSGGFAAKPAAHLLNPDNWLYKNPDHMRLFICFPESKSFRQGIEAIRRCYQTEQAIYLSTSDTLRAGDTVVFSTLLIPHSRAIEAKTVAAGLSGMEIYHSKNGYGLRIPEDNGYVQVNAAIDLEAEYLIENRRPRYDWDSGRSSYGNLQTDARYSYLRHTPDSLHYAFYSASKLLYRGQTIFKSDEMAFAQDDGSFSKPGTPKWVAWEDDVIIKY